MKAIILLVALAAGACSPKLAFSNSAGGVIEERASIGAEKNFQLAQEHCAEHGKLAEITDRDYLSNTTQFRCVDE